MKLGKYFEEILQHPEYQEWEKKMGEQVTNRINEVLAETVEDTKWKCGFIEGIKFVLADPHRRAQDTETPDAEG